MNAIVLLSSVLVTSCAACAAGGPPQECATAPAAPAAPDAPDAGVDAGAAQRVAVLLDRLAERGRAMKDFRASVVVEQVDGLTEEREVRRARVVVAGGAGPQRAIGIVIDDVIDATGRGSTDGRRFVYIDGWLVEIDAQRKQAVRRQLARPGLEFDPLKPGDGLFIVPLGQPRAEVERAFVVTMGSVPKHAFFKSLQGTAGAEGSSAAIEALHLVPREGTEAHRDVRSMELLFDAATLAPRGVEVINSNGDIERVLLRDSVIDGGLDDAQRDLVALPDLSGWRVDERPLPSLRDPAAPAPAAPPAPPATDAPAQGAPAGGAKAPEGPARPQG